MLGVGCLLVFISSCSPVTSQGQPSIHNEIPVEENIRSIGQTFTSRQDGLIGIKLFMRSDKDNEEIGVSFSIYDSPQKQQEYIKFTKRVVLSQDGRFTDFTFSPPLNSYLKDYYLEITLEQKGTVYFAISDLSSYDDGSLYLNTQAVDAQLSFIPLHDPSLLFQGLVKQGVEWLWWILLTTYLFVLPGLVISNFLAKKNRNEPWQLKLSLSVALGVSIYPLLLLMEDLIGLKVGFLNALIPGGASLVYLLLCWWKGGRKVNLRFLKSSGIVSLASLFILFTVVFTRFWAIRTLPLPMWGDSVHHNLIAQLITEKGGLFNFWQPYADMESLTYHFGFHANVAAISWLSGMSAPKSTLLGGQIINIFAVVVLFPLAWKLSRSNEWSGAVAWLVAGLFSFMPMFYVNWGRYTQLAGQVLLPVIVYLLWELVEDGRWDLKKSTMIGLLSASLAVTHYRVFIFLIASLPPLLLYIRKQNLSEILRNFLWIGVTGMLMFAPWGFRLVGGQLSKNLATQVTTPPSALGDFAREYNQIGSLTIYLPSWVWLLLVLVIVLGIWKHEKNVIFVLVWWIMIVFLANPAWLNLPGSGVLSNFAVFIGMYIPAGILIGSGFGWIFDKTRSKASFRYSQLILLVVFVPLCLFFSRERIRDVNPNQYALATRSDIRAAQWVKENLPIESKILVNSFFAYGGTVIVGSDGGWWLPALTGRKISLPPMPYTTEKGPFPGYAQYVNDLRWLIEKQGYTSAEVIDELRQRGIEYAYIGQKRGRVNYSGSVVMNPEEMIGSGFYEPLYHQDGVWVLKIK
ncbi:MAG: hypothetical protein KatS3mg028_1392 [Bacteroidia bacterium]|nr:MAG: hypothetical protein KatS3mg028_1392 [Bacteroidia bacterium]